MSLSSPLRRGALAFVVFGLACVAPPGTRVSTEATTPRRDGPPLPARFEENDGQFPSWARFVARGPRGDLVLSDEGATLLVPTTGHHSPPDVLTLRLAGQRFVVPRASEPLATRTNYLIGPRSAWRTGVPSFALVRYASVLDGVDLVFHGESGAPEYDVLLAPGVSPETLVFEVSGRLDLSLTAQGDLSILTRHGVLLQRRPRILQRVGAEQREIAARYRLVDASHFAFETGEYDRSRPLLVDPTLDLSTYLGGTGSDSASGVALGSDGSIYVTGSASSIDFPTVGGLAEGKKSGTAFISKFSRSGSSLVYSTYLGGTGGDSPEGIAVDSNGSAYVAGTTKSADFPMANALYPDFGGDGGCPTDRGFVAELTPAGDALVYGTYLGGHDGDEVRAVGLDGAGGVYVAGGTSSKDFPTKNSVSSWQAVDAGAYVRVTHGFVMALGPGGRSLAYSSILGGSGGDEAVGIAVDAAGDAFVTGWTSSPDFPTRNALQPVFPGGNAGFLTKLSPAGAVVYSTFLGSGTAATAGTGVAIDASGDCYVVGPTGPGYPLMNPIATTGASFLSEVLPDGSGFAFSTYLADGQLVALDAANKVYVADNTDSAKLPAFNALSGSSPNVDGKNDVFLQAIAPGGGTLAYATYLGDGSGAEGQPQEVGGIVGGGAGEVYVVGFTNWTNFPVVNALCSSAPIGSNAFLARVSTSGGAGGGGNRVPNACPTSNWRGDRPGLPAACNGYTPDSYARMCNCRAVGGQGGSSPWRVGLMVSLAFAAALVGRRTRARSSFRPRPDPRSEFPSG